MTTLARLLTWLADAAFMAGTALDAAAMALDDTCEDETRFTERTAA